MTTTRPVTSGTVDLGLSGAVVLVTGGARGVGAGIASVLAGLGAVPVICGRTAPGAGNEVSEPNQPRPAPHEFLPPATSATPTPLRR